MDDISKIQRALGIIEGKLDILTLQLNEIRKAHHDRMNRIDREINDVDARLRSVEKKQYSIVVIATFLASIASVFFRKLF